MAGSIGAVLAAVVDDDLVDARVALSGITARVSASSPSGPHMWPEVRIIAGMLASTITSLGTCRLVMPFGRSRPWPARGRPRVPASTASA